MKKRLPGGTQRVPIAFGADGSGPPRSIERGPREIKGKEIRRKLQRVSGTDMLYPAGKRAQALETGNFPG